MSHIDRRRTIIARVIKTLEELEGHNQRGVDIKELCKGELALQICEEYGCSMRTAKEYINVARLRNGSV